MAVRWRVGHTRVRSGNLGSAPSRFDETCVVVGLRGAVRRQVVKNCAGSRDPPLHLLDNADLSREDKGALQVFLGDVAAVRKIKSGLQS